MVNLRAAALLAFYIFEFLQIDLFLLLMVYSQFGFSLMYLQTKEKNYTKPAQAIANP